MRKEAHHTAPLRYRPPPCKYCGKMTTRVTMTQKHEGGTNSKPFTLRRILCHKCGRRYKVIEPGD